MYYIGLICCIYIIYFNVCELEHIFDENHKSKKNIIYYSSWILLILLFVFLATGGI